MKSIQIHTAIATDAGAYADSGSILAVPDEVSETRAAELIESGCAAEVLAEPEDTAPKAKAKA